MKKIYFALVALICLISIYSFKSEDEKKQLVIITVYNESLSKTKFTVIDNGQIKETEIKQRDQAAEKYRLLNEYISAGYTIASSNNTAAVIGTVYSQQENIYLVK